MNLAAWLRAFNAVSGVAEASRLFRSARTGQEPEAPLGGPGSAQLEARLASVVVAALKEAFDRDRARFNLERGHLDAERERAEEALRLEWLRQIGEHALGQIRMIAVMSLGVWVASALLVVWLPAVRDVAPRVLLALGWSALIGTLACASVAHNSVTVWLDHARASVGPAAQLPPRRARAILPWLLVLGLGLTAASVIAAL